MDLNAGWFGRLQQNIVVGVLRRSDRLPRHIGIVMDGNRRYARRHGADRKSGHASGFETMNHILAVAYSAGIAEVSVYAFSIENFHRTPAEVEDLMDIARTRLQELIANTGIAQQYGVRVNIVGHLASLPEDIQALAHKIMESTAQNTQAILNLCMPYTARDDMAQAVAALSAETAQKTKSPAGHKNITSEGESTPPYNNTAVPDISEKDIFKHMRTHDSLPLDVSIRTSDTFRFSDFLLWEINDYTYIDFVPELWPAYTPVNFLCTIMRWRIRGSM